ncbi:hypothetical protein SAMD00019534_068880 [Acytostelium subglobosum LB1]|uniref:hypothetical protein n=1 Tax=Acytostelium subglobosum LB1 TaxID=1410327 RepID=UPI00064516DC|nr:hypothetical protein SAMD00019534_068880 [Acytostelium subglobosum LB1]GAM23713.1 hypothetical protein SAMD00019534_068880 [Acytostelium subglobosum LB1]|eukprot:XP_012753454.1 hypothetical protein SAMD00019534_068880 [Acytostelium subglobosum LB1]
MILTVYVWIASNDLGGVTLLQNSDVEMIYNARCFKTELPPTLTHLEVGYKFRMFKYSFLPDSLTSLRINSCNLIGSINFGMLPTSLKTLDLDKHVENYSTGMNGKMPSSITSLSLGSGYNYDIVPGLLPQSLISLTLGTGFNQQIRVRVLPLTLETLIIGDQYNHEFGLGVLPLSLTTLSFVTYSSYNKEFLPGVLPDRLQSLSLGAYHKQKFRVGSLPASLTFLSLGTLSTFAYERQLEIGSLPTSLQTLVVGEGLIQSYTRGILPNSLTSLSMPMNEASVIEPGALPNSLRSLSLSNRPVITVGMLPNSLQSLFFVGRFDVAVPVGALPESLTELSFSGCPTLVHQFAPGMLPSSIKSLTMSSTYIYSFKHDTLPSSLTSLKFGRTFNGAFPSGMLPSTITELDLGDSYSSPLTADELPSSLTSLRVRDSSVTFPRLERLEIRSLDNIKSIKCDYIGSLVISSNIDSKKKDSKWPSTNQHFGSFTIGSRSHTSTTDPKHRAVHIKSLIKSIPNADSYNIHSQEWSVQLRKTDQWNTIILISTFNRLKDNQTITNKKRILFFTLDKSGELVATLEDEINRLKKENDRLTNQAKLMEVSTKTDQENNRLKQEIDQLKNKVERLDQEKNEETKKFESVSNQLNQYLKEWEINVVVPTPSKPVAKSTRRRK